MEWLVGRVARIQRPFLARSTSLHKALLSILSHAPTDCFGARRLCILSIRCAPRNDCTPRVAFTSELLRRQHCKPKSLHRRRRLCEAMPQREGIVAQVCSGFASSYLIEMTAAANSPFILYLYPLTFILYPYSIAISKYFLQLWNSIPKFVKIQLIPRSTLNTNRLNP